MCQTYDHSALRRDCTYNNDDNNNTRTRTSAVRGKNTIFENMQTVFDVEYAYAKYENVTY